MSTPVICLIVVVAIIVVLFLGVISISNNIVKAVVKIEEASSDIDVALTKRYDVLTKMIEVVKGYAKHEQETLFSVIDLRKGMSIDEKNKVNQEMNDQFNKINVIAEAYPELKSSENYNTLQKSIVDVEEHLQASRRLYNANVSSYNQMIQIFPNSIIANLKGYVKKNFFEADKDKKNDVKIDL